MRQKLLNSGTLALLAGILLFGSISISYAQPQNGGGYGYMGPGMMGGYGGYGMMGGYGYGMGGYGMGYGLLDRYTTLNLTTRQRDEISRIQADLRRRQEALFNQMTAEHQRMAQLYSERTPNSRQVGEEYSRMANLRRQMIEAQVGATNRANAVLTPAQRKEVQQWQNQYRRGRGRGPGGYGPGYGYMMGPGMMGW